MHFNSNTNMFQVSSVDRSGSGAKVDNTNFGAGDQTYGGRAVTWHRKGIQFLTGNKSANNKRGTVGAYQYYFDFNDGKSNNPPSGWPNPYKFMRGCVYVPRVIRRADSGSSPNAFLACPPASVPAD